MTLPSRVGKSCGLLDMEARADPAGWMAYDHFGKYGGIYSIVVIGSRPSVIWLLHSAMRTPGARIELSNRKYTRKLDFNSNWLNPWLTHHGLAGVPGMASREPFVFYRLSILVD